MDTRNLLTVIAILTNQCLNYVSCEVSYQDQEESASSQRTPKFLNFDVRSSTPDANSGIWMVALVGILAFTLPAVLMEPSLGIRRTLRYVMPSRSPLQVMSDAYDQFTSPTMWHGMAESLSITLHIVLDALEKIADKYEDQTVNEI